MSMHDALLHEIGEVIRKDGVQHAAVNGLLAALNPLCPVESKLLEDTTLVDEAIAGPPGNP